ncbi:hermansky-pudlak syndrome protein [Anaeramoeba ignava]|uniref:Hermansky-pudlak syndrome protein n=1 Tax=Anaeramoeba ignava TaxID=1746090 RepID=A0A9Q0LHG8_ANAIG|nr:hermansky-pudlak syndrome protein [Anaeramoeba ignava]
MKRFHITNELGLPIFHQQLDPQQAKKRKWDLKEIRYDALILPFLTCNTILHKLNEKLEIIKAEKSSLITINFDNVIFLVLTTKEEPFIFSIHQLNIIHNIFLFRFGKEYFKNLQQSRQIQASVKQEIHKLIHSYNYLCDNFQNFRLHSLEATRNKSLYVQFHTFLQDTVYQNDGILQAFLFSDLKILSQVKSKKKHKLIVNENDLLNLMIYLESLFHFEDNFKKKSKTENSDDKFVDQFALENEKTSDNSDLEVDMNDSMISTSSFLHEKVQQEQDDEKEKEKEKDENLISNNAQSLEYRSILHDSQEMLYFSQPEEQSFPVYSAKLMDSLFLVFIIDPEYQEIAQEAQRKKMREIAEKFKFTIRNYLNILPIPEFTISSYIKLYPGILHFVLINRTKNTMVKPKISGFSLKIPKKMRKKNVHFDFKQKLLSKDDIKQEFWKVCDFAQKSLYNGNLYAISNSSPFFYSYQLWFEDENHERIEPYKEFVIENSRNLVFSSNFYRNLRKQLVPQHKNANCFEFFSLFGFLPSSQMVAFLNRKILEELRNFL